MIKSSFKVFAFGLMVVASSCSSAGKKADPAPTPSPTPSPVASPAAKVAPAKAEVAGSRLDVQCANGEDKRLITVVPTTSGCELHYSKFGNSSVIANSANGVAHCESTRAKVRKNLEAAGFTCQ